MKRENRGRFIVLFILLFLLTRMAYSQMNLENPDELKIDQTTITISSVGPDTVLLFSVQLYGSPFENGELSFEHNKLPFFIEVPEGNFIGLISKTGGNGDIKVKIEEYYQGGLVLTAENEGSPILVRRRNNWAAANKIELTE
ncbi:hypothetical protein JW824_14530 [bacterium]|nr:hypothetical protein [bacterium]